MEVGSLIIIIVLFVSLFTYGMCLWKVTKLGAILWFCLSIVIAFIMCLYSFFQNNRDEKYYIIAGVLTGILLSTTSVAIYKFRCGTQDPEDYPDEV